MKTVWEKIQKFFSCEVVCLAALLTGLIYGVYYMDIMNPLQYSLSEIGRYNIALFVVWSVLTGTAILLNVLRFYNRVGYSGKLGRILLYVGLGALVLTFLNMKKDPAVFYWIHVATAIIFAIACFASIAYPLIFLSKTNKKYRIMSGILFSLMFVDVVFIAIFKQMALYEFIPVVLAFLVLFFTNYTNTFLVTEKDKEYLAKAK